MKEIIVTLIINYVIALLSAYTYVGLCTMSETTPMVGFHTHVWIMTALFTAIDLYLAKEN